MKNPSIIIKKPLSSTIPKQKVHFREREPLILVSSKTLEREGEMGRAPCCDKANVKKGPWSPEEDSKLKDYIEKYGTGGNWIALPHKAGN